jgi:hypothetical protein
MIFGLSSMGYILFDGEGTKLTEAAYMKCI